MTSADEAQRYERLFEAFEHGRSLPESEREPWLAALAARDADLAREVRRLLSRREGADEDPLADDAIEARRPLAPWVAVENASAADEALPEHIGLFRVLRRLGAGGMGVVYEAEQETPRRRVALKLVRPGLAFGERLKRFRLEAEALGRLKHPGIAAIHEVGTCDLGSGEQPYFVMELVEGRPLLVHAAEARLDRRARLALVAELCDAVQHAHERGIVHRDLKPDNVLVGADGRAKVLDFGVARVRAGDVPLTTIHTAQGEIVGTLTHMAPEQLAGDPSAVGPAVDVYALGVIAFELLTGRLPHEVAGLSLTQAARHITEVDAPRLGTLDRALRGDLETIVAKSLDADPARRYVTPAALASDLRRYLASEPIAARPAGLAYRASKYTRRHPGLVGGSAFAVLSLTLGLIVAWNFALDAHAGRRAAEAASYRHVLNSVAGTLDQPASDVERALLLEAPESLRSWEWDYLRARTADPTVFLAQGSVSPDALATVEGVPLLAAVIRSSEKARLQVREARQGRLVFALDLPAGRRVLASSLDEDGELRWVETDGSEVTARRVRLPGGEERPARRLEGVDPAAGSMRLLGRRLAMKPPTDRDVDTGLPMAQLGDADLSDVLDLRQAWENDMALVVRATGEDLLRLPSTTGRFFGTNGRLLTSSENLLIRVWDTNARPVREIFSLTVDVELSGAAITPDNRALLLVDRSGVLTEYLLDGSGTRTVLARPGLFAPRCWPDGRYVVLVAPGLAEIRALDATLPRDNVLTTHASYAYDVAPSASLGILATAGWDGHVGSPGGLRLLDLDSGREIRRLGSENWIGEWVSWIPGTNDLLVCGRGEADGTKSPDAKVRRLDVLHGDVAWERNMGRVQGLVCSPDGTSFAVAFGFSELSLLDARDGSERWHREFDSHTPNLRSLAWSPDGRLLAFPDVRTRTLVLADPQTGEAVREWPIGDVTALAFSPDGSLLAQASRDHRVRLWNPHTGQAIGAPLEHPDELLSLAFHPGGTRLAVGRRSGAIHVWNVETHEDLLQLEGHTAYVLGLAWTDEGRTLLSASGDGTVRRWSSRTARELAEARDEHARLVDELRPRVDTFLAGEPTRAAIDAWLRTCADSPREREVALQLVAATRWPSTSPR